MIPAAVGTSRHTSSAGISFNVCCHSNGQRQTELDVPVYIYIFKKLLLSFETGAVPLVNCKYFIEKTQQTGLVYGLVYGCVRVGSLNLF